MASQFCVINNMQSKQDDPKFAQKLKMLSDKTEYKKSLCRKTACSMCMKRGYDAAIATCGHFVCNECFKIKNATTQCIQCYNKIQDELLQNAAQNEMNTTSEPSRFIHPSVLSNFRMFGGCVLQTETRNQLGFLSHVLLALFVAFACISMSLFKW